MMTSPIVRTARRAGQTAVASIPRQVLSGLLAPVRMFAACVFSMKIMRLAKRHRNMTLAFYERRDFASQPPRTIERVYYRWSRDVKRDPSMDDTPCPDLTQVRTNVDYTSHSHSREAIKVSPSAHPALFCLE